MGANRIIGIFAIPASQILIFVCVHFFCHCSEGASNSDSYLLSGRATCLRSNDPFIKERNSVEFLVAVTDEVCLTGCSLQDKGEKFFWSSSKNLTGITIETKVIEGDVLSQTAKREIIGMVKQPGRPTSNWDDRFSSAQLSTFQHYLLPLFLASHNHGIQRSTFTSFLKSGKSTDSERLDCGELKIFGIKCIERIEFLQTVHDKFQVSSPVTLSQTTYGIFRKGIKRTLRTAKFSPPFEMRESGPWECRCETQIEGQEGELLQVSYNIQVDRVSTATDIVHSFIDSITGSVRDGSPIVSSEKIKTVWVNGEEKKAVDYKSLELAKKSIFRNSKTFWTSLMGICGLLFIIVYLKRYLK